MSRETENILLDEVIKLRQSQQVSLNLLHLAQNEIERLVGVIVCEGERWATHHTDPVKKQYWRNFQRKATQR